MYRGLWNLLPGGVWLKSVLAVLLAVGGVLPADGSGVSLRRGAHAVF
ncbi:hypothetical protein CIP107578_00170 [Corynebacterium diphtheriae]|nr:hypothetical protein CIP107558_00170 [Corynebacterium diphtheriae]CAB0628128.1 hypothetical protein CIP107578_00170 [Corynebacterium diphtheriae]